MREEDINRVESAECPATFLFQPRSQQSLDRCAERRQIKRLFDELERARRSAFRGNLGRNRAADHECARVRVRGAKFLEYDKAKELVKEKQAQIACLRTDTCGRMSIYS